MRRKSIINSLKVYTFQINTSCRNLQLIAGILLSISFIFAFFINFRASGITLAFLLLYLLLVRWAAYPQGFIFAAKTKLIDSLIILLFTISIIVFSIIAP